MTKEITPLSKPSLVVDGAGKPHAPLGAPRPPRPFVRSAVNSPTLTCDSPSQPPGCGAGKPYAPLGAPRTPRTSLSSVSLGHASDTTHALIPGSPPVSLPQSDACPPTATFTRGPSSNQEVNGNQSLATPSWDPLTCPNPVNPHKDPTNRILPNDAPTLAFATWNANGLLTAEGLPETRRKAKKRALNKLLHDNDAVAVQETHGLSTSVPRRSCRSQSWQNPYC